MNWEEMCRPHSKELYGYISTKNLFESSCQLVSFETRGLVDLVREGDLLVVVLGEQTHLFAMPVSKRLRQETIGVSSPYAAFLRGRELYMRHGRIL